MIIFIVVGMPASGKNIARMYAEEHHHPYFATGDVVREEGETKGLALDAESTAALSTQLRGHDGMGVTRIALGRALDSGKEIVFMEGMRSWAEVELIGNECTSRVIAFVAPRTLRLQRVTSRGRPDDSPAAFDERDLREVSYGTAVPIARADAYIMNTADIADALADLDSVIKSILAGVRDGE